MFRQIQVAFDDIRYHLIFWHPDNSGPILPFRLMTVTYGTAPAPYLALRVLQQLITDEGSRYPLAKTALTRNIYVDDALFGASTKEDSLKVHDEVRALMNSGCLPLRKWTSSDPKLLAGLPTADCESVALKPLQEDQKIRILGLSCSPGTDCLHFQVHAPSPANLSKRTVLSHIARLYDPLGLVAPVIVVAKILMQQLWSLGLDWDSPLSNEMAQAWNEYFLDLVHLNKLRIPRWIYAQPSAPMQLHGFCDASQRAYAAAVYVRVVTASKVHVCLLTSKTRVAPKKYISIPRLELCAAELLSRLLKWTVYALDSPDLSVFAWSDSSVTLNCIASCSSRWKVYVANRVAVIQDTFPATIWRHVPTRDNPADLASRGVAASELIDSSLWWYGPAWLVEAESAWPQSTAKLNIETDLE